MAEPSVESPTRQFLTFKLGEEMFAPDVSQMCGILDVTTVTKVPGTPSFMRGVTNLH
jgi:purine-binding chemotaxis protein CheW